MSRSFKKNNYLKVYRKGCKKIYRKQLRRYLNDLDNELSNGNMYRKHIERYDFIQQRSYMSESYYDNKFCIFIKLNDFYSNKMNWYKCFKYK